MPGLSPEEFKELYNEGVDCFNEGNYIKAQGLLKEVLRNNPNLADIHNKLGVIANLEGNLEEAASHFGRAVEINPNYTEASLNLAITLNELGRAEDAVKAFNRISESIGESTTGLDPFAAGKIANEHYKLGKLYQEFGMSAEAVEEYRKALKLRPMADVMAKLGISLREMGDLKGAASELEKAHKENPAYTSAMVQLGLTYYYMGRHEEAISLWEQALAKNPDLKEPKAFLKMFKKKG